MKEEMARAEFPNWANSAVRIVDEDDGPVLVRQWKHEQPGQRRRIDWERLVKRYGIVVAGAALFTLYTIVLSWCVHAGAVKETRAEMMEWHEQEMAAYKAEQAYQEQAKSFLSGTDSLNVAINQAVDAIAPVVARLQTDEQKQTEVGIMIARTLNSGFPNSLQEVAEQEGQWPLYDGTIRTYTAHDCELVEPIVRPFMESGKLPLDLTSDIVFASWSQTDLVGRDSYYPSSTMHTWRYHG